MLETSVPQLSDRKARLVALGAARHLWRVCQDNADTIAIALRRLEFVESNAADFEYARVTLNRISSSIAYNLAERARYRGSRARVGDWFEAWEVGNEIWAMKRDQEAIDVILASIESARDREYLPPFIEQLPKVLASIFLQRPAGPPPQLRRSMPWELPWELFMHLRGGNDEPSIYERVHEGCSVICCNAIREIVPSPFSPMAVQPEWRTAEAIGLAGAISESKAYERMSELWDALESAGCYDTQILNHCLHEDHLPGCVLLDAVLGLA
jgi:hypothetical protein